MRTDALAPLFALAAALPAVAGDPQFDFLFGSGTLDLPTGIHVAANGDLLVASFDNNKVLLFDDEGSFKATIVDSGLLGPYGVATEADGDIVVADTFQDQVQVFSPDGVPKLVIGTQGTGDGEFEKPRGVAVGKNGFIYVADTRNDRVQIFFPTGVFRSAFGTTGTGDGEFDDPWGLTTAPNGDVIVADSGNYRIQVFDSLGAFKFRFGSAGADEGEFNIPAEVDVTPSGLILVTDTFNDRIQVFTSTGDFLCQFGSTGTDAGQFQKPRGIVYSPHSGRIYVSDSENDRAQAFSAVQPDQWIGKNRGSQKGDGIYNRNGNRQKLAIVGRNRRRSRYFFTTQNDGLVPDAFAITGRKRDRHYKEKFLQLRPERENVTAAILRRNGYVTSELAPEASALFKVTVKPKRSAKRSRSVKITAASRINRGSRDAVKTRVRTRN